MIEREHVPRDLGPFAVTQPVARVLGELRHRSHLVGTPEIDADRVRAVEIGITFRFPDDLLAVFAAAVPVIAERRAVTVDKVIAHSGELRARSARGDLIGLGEQAPGLKICVSKRDRDQTRLALYDVEAKIVVESIELASWLDARLEELPPCAGAAPAFAPVITRALPGGSPGRRVRHAVFGEGRVFVDNGRGPDRKIKVDFPQHGLKLLCARFVEFLD